MDVRLLAPIATLIASSIASYLWWLNKQRKDLSVSLIRSEPLIALKGPARRKLTVYFGHRTMESAQLLQISLLNDGNQPIAASDYQSPLRIALNPGSTIYEVDIIETWPADLERRIPGNADIVKTTSKYFVELIPLLLNPQDEVVLQMLVENFNGEINVSHHISGIRKISSKKTTRTLPKLITGVGAAIILFAAFFVEPDTPYILALPSIPYCLLLILGTVFFICGQIWPQAGRSTTNAGAGILEKVGPSSNHSTKVENT